MYGDRAKRAPSWTSWTFSIVDLLASVWSNQTPPPHLEIIPRLIILVLKILIIQKLRVVKEVSCRTKHLCRIFGQYSILKWLIEKSCNDITFRCPSRDPISSQISRKQDKDICIFFDHSVFVELHLCCCLKKFFLGRDLTDTRVCKTIPMQTLARFQEWPECV